MPAHPPAPSPHLLRPLRGGAVAPGDLFRALGCAVLLLTGACRSLLREPAPWQEVPDAARYQQFLGQTFSAEWDRVPLSTAVAALSPLVSLELYPGEQGLPYIQLRLEETPVWDALVLLAETSGYRLLYQEDTVALVAPERKAEVLGKPIPQRIAATPLRRPFVQLLHTRVYSTNQVDRSYAGSDRAAAATLAGAARGDWLLEQLSWYAEAEGRLYALEALHGLDPQTAQAILATQTNTTVTLVNGDTVPMAAAFLLSMEKPDSTKEPGFPEAKPAE